MTDEVAHTYRVREIDTIPWKHWVGRARKDEGYDIYEGDCPRVAALLRRMAA